MLDLARELAALGAEVSFYSYVSRKRAASFGLLRQNHVALLPLLFPIVLLERAFPWFLPGLTERLLCWGLDLAVIARMRRCDIFMPMSGLYLLAARYARWRYGALIHLHRSSRHILSQKEILSRLPAARQITTFTERRELEGYELADRIIAPSSHVAESFAPWPELYSKVFLNPLGVDIDQFPLRPDDERPAQPTVLFVGQWSYRKGVDILTEAIRSMPNVRLVHVGALADAPFPDEVRFIHHEPVLQQKLTDYYATAHVCVLPSREDGFGVVLSQALASGLRVVCTDRTGGPDLARLPGVSRLIRIVPTESVEQLRDALIQALDDASRKTGVPPITEAERQLLGWNCYAARDLEFMTACCDQRQRVATNSHGSSNSSAASVYRGRQ